MRLPSAKAIRCLFVLIFAGVMFAPVYASSSAEREGTSTILIIIMAAIFALARVVTPKKDRRYKSGYRNFSWGRMLIGLGLHALGIATIAYMFLR